ncbi:unnamed protein product [Trichobilharzia szidati]|nr:unnamed protein product [Trichobilharzia szidati]
MSIFRNFLSCISTENITWPFVNNPLRTDNSYHSNNNNNNNYNTFPKNSCIICHESVDTCLRNQSSKCHRHSFRLLDTTRRKSLKASKQSIESQYKIKTTQPDTMTTVCATGTDPVNIPLNDSEIYGMTSSSYRRSITHPYATGTTTATTTATMTASTTDTIPTSINDPMDTNLNDNSVGLHCSKLFCRWIDYCPFLWSQKSTTSTVVRQKSSSGNNNNNNTNNEWMTITTTSAPIPATTAAAITITQSLDTVHYQSVLQRGQQQQHQDIEHQIVDKNNSNNRDNGDPIDERIEECYIPEPVFNLFLYLAQKGVYAKDLFRRPGNIAQIKHILQRFASNHTIDWKDYNIHTVATVAKRVLVNIPNGLIGLKGEKQLLQTALLTQQLQQQSDSIQVKTIKKTSPSYFSYPSTIRITSKDAPLDPPLHPSHPIHHETDEFIHVSSILPILESQTNAGNNDSSDNQTTIATPTTAESTRQSPDQIVRRAVVISNIQSNKSDGVNISLLFSYGAIQQIYQLTSIDLKRVQVFQSILKDLTSAHRQLTIIIFGILHQLVFNAAFNTASHYHSPSQQQQQETEKDTEELPKIPLLKLAEGVVKSVAGSMFHTCTSSILLIDQTTQVLQSLVLCFPVIDKEFTQFYWDVLNNRYKLRKSKQASRGVSKLNISKPVYSKSACSARLISAAGRLFCFASDHHGSDNNNNANVTNSFSPGFSPSSPASLTSSVKHFCFPLKDSNRLQKSKQSQQHQMHRESSMESTYYQHIDKTTVDQDKPMESMIVQPVYSVTSSGHTSDVATAETKDVKYSSYAKADVHETGKLLNNNNNNNGEMNTSSYSVVNLRRNQSRYRSLRRRQMENLNRRAEWFLRPTTIPSLTFTPDRLKHLDEEITIFSNNHHHSQTAMSTMSLLEMHHNMKEHLRTNLFVNSDLVQVVSPRILFTSSTSDLIQTDFSVQPTGPCEKLSASEECRTKLCPSLSPVYGHSFSSLLSVPSPPGQYYVVTQAAGNTLFPHSINNNNNNHIDCQSNMLSNYEDDMRTRTRTTTHSSFLMPTVSPTTASSIDPLICHHHRIPKYPLQYDRSDQVISRSDLLQSTSYESFPNLTYPSLLHSNLPDKTSKESKNGKVKEGDPVHIPPTLLTPTTRGDDNNNTRKTSCHAITTKSSDTRSSDWSIDQPIFLPSENLHRRRSSALTTLQLPKKTDQQGQQRQQK